MSAEDDAPALRTDPFAPDTVVVAVAVAVAVPSALFVAPAVGARPFLLAMAVGVSPSFAYRQFPHDRRSLTGHARWGFALALGALVAFMAVVIAGRAVGLAASTASLVGFGATAFGGVWLARRLAGR